jgi:hypothetical protein
MRSSKKTRNSVGTTTSRMHSLSTLAVTGGLLLSSLSTQLSAAETNYGTKEGYTHTAEQLGTGLTPPLGISTLKDAMRSSSDSDNHLTLNTEHVLWFGGGIWISNIGTSLYIDGDQDGYFSAFSLTIDADTDYSQADVYATVDIRRSGGERESLHTTETFSIYGNSLTDEYRVDIELIRNYPIGDYDLFINLVDANNHALLVDSVGPSDISNLSRLPLESEDLDDDPVHFVPATPIHSHTINPDIRIVEHAGASSTWLLLALGIPILFHRLKNTQSDRKINNRTGLSTTYDAFIIPEH